MEFETQDVASAESSPATPSPEVESTPSQGALDPAQAPQMKGFHEHPDWQRMVKSRQEDRAAMQQMQSRIMAFEKAQQQAQQRPDAPLSQEESAALQTLKKLMLRDPEMAAALGLAKRSGEFDQRFQAYDRSQSAAAMAHQNAAKSYIKELASSNNLAVDDKFLNTYLIPMVAKAAMGLENGDARFQSGDMSVLDEAFKDVMGFISHLRKPAEQQIAQTKAKLRTLPQVARGAAAGQPAMPKAEAGKEREFEAALHAKAKAMLGE